MRLFVSLLPLGAIFLAGCASEGVIVQKESRPHPFYESVGVEGMYTFELRDRSGALHRQMVTPEVYERYAIGQYFNDQQVTPATNDSAEPKTVQVAMHRPTFAVGRLASTKKVSPQRQLASAKPRAAKKTQLAQKSSNKKSGTKQIATKHAKKNSLQAQHSRRVNASARLAVNQSKKSKHVAASTKAGKPWKLTETAVEASAVSQPAAPSVSVEPPAEGPSAKTEETSAKPALRETQVTPDSPLR